MKTIRALLTVLLLIGILGLSPAPVSAYEVRYVRLFGMLLPAEEEGQRGMRDRFNVSINGKAWIFQLVKVEYLRGTGGDGRAILRQVFPARLTFTGDEDLLHNLQKPEVIGNPLTITAFLYPASRVLFITAVNGTKETG